jgi:hypothetical protein
VRVAFRLLALPVPTSIRTILLITYTMFGTVVSGAVQAYVRFASTKIGKREYDDRFDPLLILEALLFFQK